MTKSDRSLIRSISRDLIIRIQGRRWWDCGDEIPDYDQRDEEEFEMTFNRNRGKRRFKDGTR